MSTGRERISTRRLRRRVEKRAPSALGFVLGEAEIESLTKVSREMARQVGHLRKGFDPFGNETPLPAEKESPPLLLDVKTGDRQVFGGGHGVGDDNRALFAAGDGEPP